RKQLIDELEKTVLREQNRIRRNHWRVDPKDDARFWGRIKDEITDIRSKPENGDKREEVLLHEIITRYANEIAGNFKPSSYRVAREITKFWFRRLLNG